MLASNSEIYLPPPPKGLAPREETTCIQCWVPFTLTHSLAWFLMDPRPHSACARACVRACVRGRLNITRLQEREDSATCYMDKMRGNYVKWKMKNIGKILHDLIHMQTFFLKVLYWGRESTVVSWAQGETGNGEVKGYKATVRLGEWKTKPHQRTIVG